ncbi:MAG: hypothetical protein MUQ18_10215 [Loktanella sp.]|nr:hypothetical protein [Loktanella sp.]
MEIAAPLKFLCCAREQMLREQKLREQKLRLHKSGLSRLAELGAERSEFSVPAQNDRPKTRPAVCIVFRYRLRLRKGRSLKNTNTLKILYFLNAPF